jgi:shikimate dehydrogenase
MDKPNKPRAESARGFFDENRIGCENMERKSSGKSPSRQQEIAQLRKEIDRIDIGMLDLINRRMTLAGRIGAVKRENGMEILDADREAQLLKSLADRNPGPVDDNGLQRIFQEILSASKTLQAAGKKNGGTGNIATASRPFPNVGPIIDRPDIDIYCLIGAPVSHSLSPAMMNAAFRQWGMPCVYTAFAVPAAALGKAVMGIRGLGIRGASVTIPHKTAVLALLDEIDPLAREIGAVNTIHQDHGRLLGYNTDAEGALSALRARVGLRGKKVAILGAGGAARAIGFGVRREGADILIVNRSATSGKRLAAALMGQSLSLDRIRDIAPDVLVNTTPVGMVPDVHASPVDPSVFQPDMVVMDAVYNPRRTRFLQTAQAAGCRIIEGIDMFVHQGARQFEIWTGKKAPVKEMRDAVIEILQASKDNLNERN